MIVYASLFGGAFIFFAKDDNFSDKDIVKPNVMSVSMITQTQKKVQKKIEKKKELVKKLVAKKIVKQKPLPKPKKILPKKKPIQKEPEEAKEEKVVEEKIVQSKPVVQETQKVQQQVVAKDQSKPNLDEIKAKQNIFFTKLRNKINENKRYPRSARRRGIEGNVEVKFYVQRDGGVKNIKFISGKKIFKNSALKAIEKSFPIEVDKSLFSFPKEFKISIKYILS